VGDCKIDIKKAAVSAGLLWGALVFWAGIMATITGSYGVGFVNAVGSIYPGYAATYPGTAIGVVWALLDGGFAGALFAYIYNKV
jgi:hypothetical protein